MIRSLALAAVAAMPPLTMAAAQDALPPLPDSTGWGVHVLAAAQDAAGTLWVGTYGKGIYRLPKGAAAWEATRSDTTPGALSWDFVHAFGFGPRGQVWYGTVGNGWGLSLDGGRTWKTWTYDQLGPEWQYVAAGGIATRGDTTMVATADGLQITTDDGQHWTAIGDTVGPPAKGPADTVLPLLTNEYVRRLALDARGWVVSTLRGEQRLRHTSRGWTAETVQTTSFPAHDSVAVGGRVYRGSHCGLRPAEDRRPCLSGAAPPSRRTRGTAHALARASHRPGGQQPHRPDLPLRLDDGRELPTAPGRRVQQPDGTPVLASGPGTVVYAGRAEAGALTVTIRHDTTVTRDGIRYRLYSTYYHNSALDVKVGDRVRTGQRISRVGNTGRATNDHLHLELAASPTDSIGAIVDSTQRFPPYTTNAELWVRPLPGTGIVAGQVVGSDGEPVLQARIYGLVKPLPTETPFSFAETYGDKGHSHPLYGEHFAVGDVPAGRYVIGTEIEGKRVLREVTVSPGKVTWVVFSP